MVPAVQALPLGAGALGAGAGDGYHHFDYHDYYDQTASGQSYPLAKGKLYCSNKTYLYMYNFNFSTLLYIYIDTGFKFQNRSTSAATPTGVLPLDVDSGRLSGDAAAGPTVPDADLVLLLPYPAPPTPPGSAYTSPATGHLVSQHPHDTNVTDNVSDTTARYSRSVEINSGLPSNWSFAHDDEGVHFRNLGSIVGSLHFGHVSFDLNPGQLLELFKTKCFEAWEAINTLDDGISNRARGNTFFLMNRRQGIQIKCNSAQEYAEGIMSLFRNPQPGDPPLSRQPHKAPVDWSRHWKNSGPASGTKPNSFKGNDEGNDINIHSRPKRQFLFGLGILLGVGVVALGSYLFGSAKLVDMSASITTGPNDETIETLQNHEKRITLNEASLVHANRAIKKLAKVTQTLNEHLAVVEDILVIENILDDLIQQMRRIFDGIRDISHLKFSTDLVSPDKLRPVIERLQQRLDQQDLKILPSQGHEFYELDTSFIYFANDTLRVYLHVPAYLEGSMYKLYEYIPSPLHVSKNRYFLPNPEHRLLAVDPRTLTSYRTMSKSALGVCHESGVRYYCPGENFYRNDPESSCLMNLYKSKLKSAVSNCPFIPLSHTKEFLAQLSATEFVLYQPELSSVSVTCKGINMPKEVVSFEGVRRLTIPAGCIAMSNTFTFDGEVDVYVQDETLAPHFQRLTDFASHFPANVLDAELDEVMKEVSLMGSPKGVKVKDIATALRASRVTTIYRFTLGIVGTCIAVLVLIVLIWCMCVRRTGSSGRAMCIKWFNKASCQKSRVGRNLAKKESKKVVAQQSQLLTKLLHSVEQQEAVELQAINPRLLQRPVSIPQTERIMELPPDQYAIEAEIHHPQPPLRRRAPQPQIALPPAHVIPALNYVGPVTRP